MHMGGGGYTRRGFVRHCGHDSCDDDEDDSCDDDEDDDCKANNYCDGDSV